MFCNTSQRDGAWLAIYCSTNTEHSLLLKKLLRDLFIELQYELSCVSQEPQLI
jgi:hypothetical protein